MWVMSDMEVGMGAEKKRSENWIIIIAFVAIIGLVGTASALF